MKKNKTDQFLEKITRRLDSIGKKIITKQDIKNMATKDDIKNMATKKDIKRLENKIIKKLNYVADHFDNENIQTNERIEKLEKRVDTFAAPS